MLVWSCIAPHGGEIIPELAEGNLARMAWTRDAMRELGKRCRAAAPETLVVYTPHGLYKDGCCTVSLSPTAQGTLNSDDGASIGAQFTVDQELAQTLLTCADSCAVPVAEALFDESGRLAPIFPLDWGALIPLWFLGTGEGRIPESERPNVVVICPSRSLSRGQLVRFGQATVEAALASGKRVGIVCSADQGHGHQASGPYGYAPLSSSYDQAYCQAVRENDLARLLTWSPDFIEGALVDSYWQTLMLHGALQYAPASFGAELLSYEAPTYFGMMCAAFAPETAQ